MRIKPVRDLDYRKLQPGDAIWDMHNSYDGPQDCFHIQQPHTIVASTVLPMEDHQGAAGIVERILKGWVLPNYSYLNKMLVVARKHDVQPRHDLRRLTCVWSYDDRTFGVMLVDVTVSS